MYRLVGRDEISKERDLGLDNSDVLSANWESRRTFTHGENARGKRTGKPVGKAHDGHRNEKLADIPV